MTDDNSFGYTTDKGFPHTMAASTSIEPDCAIEKAFERVKEARKKKIREHYRKKENERNWRSPVKD
jgi:hypothetical protein